ncbi:MAG: hypothetical protein LBD12_07220, partial [Clostridiales Family XIII bacterium]|nr:hypothetical protein [Clostridiales Family XIII bacterium]
MKKFVTTTPKYRKRPVRNHIAAVAAGMLALLLLMSGAAPAVSTAALDGKEETVYGHLTAEGALEDVYVVNHFDVRRAGIVVDHGAYLSVTNLTSTASISQGADKVSLAADEGDLYYEGIPREAKLPWLFDIGYVLDGKPTDPESLGGRSGTLRISLRTTSAPGIAPAFYENYMLQVTFTLATDRASGLVATGASVVAAGGDRKVVFTVLPGEAGDIELCADVRDFQMAGM